MKHTATTRVAMFGIVFAAGQLLTIPAWSQTCGALTGLLEMQTPAARQAQLYLLDAVLTGQELKVGLTQAERAAAEDFDGVARKCLSQLAAGLDRKIDAGLLRKIALREERLAAIAEEREVLRSQAKFARGALPLKGAQSRPANDRCATAMLLEAGPEGGRWSGATTFATTEDGAPDVWFKVAGAPGLAGLEWAADTRGSRFDTELAVYSACPGDGGEALSQSDDAFGLASAVSLGAPTPSAPVWLRVSGSGYDRGLFELNIAPAGRVTGTVTNTEEEPLADVRVHLRDLAGGYVTTATTDRAGRFVTEGVPVGDYLLQTEAEGYVNQVSGGADCAGLYCDLAKAGTLRVRAGGVTPTAIELKSGATISGRVTDEWTTDTLSGMTVSIWTQNNEYRGFGVSNSQGEYSVASLPDGPLFAFAEATDGYTPTLYGMTGCPTDDCYPYNQGSPIGTTNGQTTSGIDFALTPGGVISGRVTNANGGQALEGARIEFYMNGVFKGTTNSGADGRYTSPGMQGARDHMIIARMDGFIGELFNDVPCFGACDLSQGHLVWVTHGGDAEDHNIALSPGGTITGKVTANGTGEPLEGIQIDISNVSAEVVASVFTNADGDYAVTLPAGTYFAVALASYPYEKMPYGAPIPAVVGETLSGIDFALLLGGSISGVLLDNRTDEPIANASVNIWDGNNNFAAWAQTDDDGLWSTTVSGILPSGNYYVVTQVQDGIHFDELWQGIICPPDTGGCWPPNAGTPVGVQAETDTSSIDFALEPYGGISGNVSSDRSGLPIPGVTIEVWDSAGDRVATTTTNDEGNFQKIGLPIEELYYVTAEGPDMDTMIYDGVICTHSCDPTTGTSIIFGAGVTVGGINFLVDTSQIFKDDFESGNVVPQWSAAIGMAPLP